MVLAAICITSCFVASQDDQNKDTMRQQVRAAFGAVAAFLAAFAALSLVAALGKKLIVVANNTPQTWFHVFLVYAVFGSTAVANFYGGSG